MPYIEDKDLEKIKEDAKKHADSSIKLFEQLKAKTSALTRIKKSKKRMGYIALLFALAFYALLAVLFFNPSFILDTTSTDNTLREIEMTKEIYAIQEKMTDESIRGDSLMIENKKLVSNNKILQSENQKLKEENAGLVDFQKNQALGKFTKKSEYLNQIINFKDYIKGKRIYAVQIGLYKQLNLEMISKDFLNFRGVKKKGYVIYSLGNFTKRQDAENLKNTIVKMGLKGCFVVDYVLD